MLKKWNLALSVIAIALVPALIYHVETIGDLRELRRVVQIFAYAYGVQAVGFAIQLIFPGGPRCRPDDAEVTRAN